jgi:amino-acid N-acetyltransferase
VQRTEKTAFVNWFRSSSPYIHAFRGRTFVITFGGELAGDASFPHFIQDVALLSSLGIRLVLVHGARPQIDKRLMQSNIEWRYVRGVRITDPLALACVVEAVGAVRTEIEAQLSMGLANSPMAGARIRVASGNFVTARPVGVRDGVDHQHTGEVRRVDAEGIRSRLDAGAIVLISPVGYSPTGEIFNLAALDVATATASTLRADKLLCLAEAEGLRDRRRRLIRQVGLVDAEALLARGTPQSPETVAHLQAAVQACRKGVRRTHVVDRRIDGALLLELFTRDGIGTLVSADLYEGARDATIEDVGGILELIRPLEEEGILVRRSREQLELDIENFRVIERDGTIIACAALHAFPEEKTGELACLAVHPDYRESGRGDTLLDTIEARARDMGLERLFVLTTRTVHWFRERGFVPADIGALPVKKQALYNYQRNSKVLAKNLRN